MKRNIIDAICAIDRFSVINNTLLITLTRRSKANVIDAIDDFVMRDVTAAREFIKRRFNAINLEYMYEQ